MADALCGPSNALQSFKRHTQGDRSLQQDRLAGPRTPVQGFRSHDPRAGSLDAEFNAFENASATPFQEPFGANNNFAAQPRHLHQHAPANWASDFQHLSIADQPVPAQQFRNYAPMVKSTNGGWQNEFVRQQHGAQSAVAQGKQVAFDQSSMSSYAPQMQYQGGFAPMSTYAPQMDGQQFSGFQQPQHTGQLVESDWSHAFEEAFQDAFQDVEQTEQASLTKESIIQPEELIQTHDQPLDVERAEQIRIGSDAIEYTEMKDRTADQEKQDASALARVAGELLHNVQHDSSEKFQNSQFLDLMRKIRDRQVEVRNNDFESTSSGMNETIGQNAQHLDQMTDTELRNAPDPTQNQETFAFPDMNAVHAPREADFVDYSFDSDQFPSQTKNQISELHPGGRLYPEQSPSGNYAQMSGAVPADSTHHGRDHSHSISAADFEASYDESRTLASRFRRAAA